jgi:hypothetical protein
MDLRPSNTFRRPLKLFAATLACGVVGGCATAAPPDHGLPPERLAQLRHICAETMQLSPGNAHFEDCVDVLSETARQNDRAKGQQ